MVIGFLGLLEGGREQVGGRQAAVGPPFFRDRQNLFLSGQMIEAVSRADSLAKREVDRAARPTNARRVRELC
jgi:hypothetical protein